MRAAWGIVTAPTESERQGQRELLYECLFELGHQEAQLPLSEEDANALVSRYGDDGEQCAYESGVIPVITWPEPIWH